VEELWLRIKVEHCISHEWNT